MSVACQLDRATCGLLCGDDQQFVSAGAARRQPAEELSLDTRRFADGASIGLRLPLSFSLFSRAARHQPAESLALTTSFGIEKALRVEDAATTLHAFGRLTPCRSRGGETAMKAWLLTSTFYGTWLPGDERGFVSRVRDRRPDEAPLRQRHEHDQYGEAFDADLAGLRESARQSMRGPAIQIGIDQAHVLLSQFQETAQFRNWGLHAVAIMAEHVHWVVTLPETSHGSIGLRDFKSYGSRALTQRFGQPKSETWWTSKGSNRWLPDEAALRTAIEYVRNQKSPLLIWINPNTRL